MATAAKTGIVTVISFTSPLQTNIGIRLSNCLQKIGTYVGQESVSKSFTGEERLLVDPNLKDGRFICYGFSGHDTDGWVYGRIPHRPDLANRDAKKLDFEDVENGLK